MSLSMINYVWRFFLTYRRCWLFAWWNADSS